MVQPKPAPVAADPSPPARPAMLARIRCKGMEVVGIAVQDLSLAGCMVATGAWLPREEQRLLVSLPGIANLPAAVLWVETGRAGVLFDELLNEVVYEHLVAGFAMDRTG